ncbi:MAG: hypothetical protein GTO03_17665, partial [Planctomycetales bacterium]|nr:hypothetical protein [Planctomycetales bacterium]
HTPTTEAQRAVTHWVPADQPQRVSDLADRFLGEYQVAEGSVHLAGCTFDEVPVIRWRGDVEGA